MPLFCSWMISCCRWTVKQSAQFNLLAFHVFESYIKCFDSFHTFMSIFKFHRMVFPCKLENASYYFFCCIFHSLNLPSNDFMFERRELRIRLETESFRFSSEGYVLRSIMNARPRSHLLSLSFLAEFPVTPTDCLPSFQSLSNLVSMIVWLNCRTSPQWVK